MMRTFRRAAFFVAVVGLPLGCASNDGTGGTDGTGGADGSPECPDGRLLCGDVCTDVSADPTSCGNCGTTCAVGATCVMGQCQCPTGTSVCGSTCTNLATDSLNCGQCGTVCAAGRACQNGACGDGVAATGGAAGTGGTGGATGGAPITGGTGGATGGAPITGGTGGATGGTPITGGAGGATGGAPPTGGLAGSTGGEATGGTGGDLGTGGDTSTGGASPLGFTYWIAADVSFEETQSEATRANLLSILQEHGFNSIRLRTFVDPRASDGYGMGCDLEGTIAFGKQIKAAGMGFLVDFHYSDNWADPGKQCVPIAWQGYGTITELANAVHDYTSDAITQLIAAGARPDMVQVGNETTHGMLIDRCDSGGQPTGTNPITGSTSNWDNLGALLKAGVDGVKEVDPGILVSFHIDKGGDHDDGTSALNTSISWLTNALKYTPVDAFGESCYQSYQGDSNSPSHSKTIWQNVLGGLASRFPDVKFFAAEYGPAQREINDVVYNLPNQQGLGTFNWEPTFEGAWNTGHTLLSRSGNTYVAQPDLSLYDQMKVDYADRL